LAPKLRHGWAEPTETAIGYILPKLIGEITPGGVVPSGIPAALAGLLQTTPTQTATFRVEQVAPRAINLIHGASHLGWWLIPLLAGLGVLGLFWYLLSGTPPAPVVATYPSPTVLPPAPGTAPAPPVTAPPPPTSSDRIRHGVFWNTFLSRRGEDDPHLVAGAPSSYVLTLDLSAYDYADFVSSAVRGAAADRRFGEYLGTARPGALEVKIRPIVIGGELMIEGPPIQKMAIAREKLDWWPRTGEAPKLEANLGIGARYYGTTVGELSKILNAGTVSFPVRAQSAGCAAILFTIWNIDDIPLDQVLLRLPVYRNDDSTDCPTDSARNALSGGFATFLDPQLGLGPKAPPTVDAALHVFEMIDDPGDKKKRVSILIDKAEYKQQSGLSDRETGVYVWRSDSLLSEYIGKANGLPQQIARARDAAYGGQSAPYANAADELADVVFAGDPTDASTAVSANGALEALKKIAEKKGADKQPAVLLARLIGPRNEKLYMPLGLLGAAGNHRALPRPVIVVQPLAEERYTAGVECIDPWAFGVTSQLQDLPEDVKSALQNLPPKAPAPTWEDWVDTLDKLRRYLGSNADAPSAGNGEGLLLLAHHDEDYVWYDDDARLTRASFRRHYHRGSVAILAACATSNPRDDMALLKTLNHNGIDAMVVSPFMVQVDYGGRLVYELTQVIREHRTERNTPTLAELFSEATRNTAAYFAQRSSKRYEEMGLEYVLAGDAGLTLCPAPHQEQSPR